MSLGRPEPIGPDQIPRAAEIVAAAFADYEPWGEWALPDPATRVETLRALVERDLRERFSVCGEAWILDSAAVAMWIPPEGSEGSAAFESRRDDEALALYGDMAEVIAESDDLISELRPDQPHWYLDTLATDPASFGRGYGTALLDFCLARRDAAADGAPCALDTHTRPNVQLYARRGFQVLSETRLPADGPSLWMMLRPAVHPA